VRNKDCRYVCKVVTIVILWFVSSKYRVPHALIDSRIIAFVLLIMHLFLTMDGLANRCDTKPLVSRQNVMPINGSNPRPLTKLEEAVVKHFPVST